MKRVARRLTGENLMSCFDQWAGNVYDLKRQRGVLERIRFRMKSRRAVASFNRWVEFVDELHHNRHLFRKLILNITNIKITSAFHIWKDFSLNDYKFQVINKRRKRMLKILMKKRYDAFTLFGFQKLHKLYNRDVNRYNGIKRFCRTVRFSFLMKGFKRWHMAAITIGFYTERRRIMIKYEQVLALSRWQLFTGQVAREAMYERENGILRRQVQNMIYKLQLRMPGNLPRHKTLLELRLSELSTIQRKLEKYQRPFNKWQKWDTGLLEKKRSDDDGDNNGNRNNNTDLLDVKSLNLYVHSRFDDTLVLTPQKSMRKSTSTKSRTINSKNIKNKRRSLSSTMKMQSSKKLTLHDLKEGDKNKTLLALSPVGTQIRKLQDEVYESALKHSRSSFNRLGGKKAWH